MGSNLFFLVSLILMLLVNKGNAQDIDTDKHDPLYQKALDLCDSQEYVKASQILEDLLAKSPNNTDYWWTLGYCNSSLSDDLLALHCFLRIQSMNTSLTDAETLTEVGDKYSEVGKDTEAVRFLRQSVLFDTSNIRAYELLLNIFTSRKDINTSRNIFYSLIKNDTAKSSFPYASMGQMYQSLFMYDSAIKYFNKALYFDFHDDLSRFSYADCLINSLLYNNAILYLKPFVDSYKSDPRIYLKIAKAYIGVKDFKNALDYLRASEDKSSNDSKVFAEIYYLKSKCFEVLPLAGSALDYARMAIKLQPDKWQHTEQLCFAYMVSKDYDNAIAACKVMLEQFPDQHFHALELVTSILIRKKLYDKAIENGLKILRIDPDNFSSLIDVGYSYSKIHNYKAEVEYTRSALRIQPNSILAHANYAAGLLHLGKKEEAKQEYQILLSLGAKREAQEILDIIEDRKSLD